MFMIIGNDEVIKTEEIICILDYQLMKTAKKLQLIKEQKNNIYLVENEDQIKSIIITEGIIYYSPFSTHTLKKRESFYTTIKKLELTDNLNLNEGEPV